MKKIICLAACLIFIGFAQTQAQSLQKTQWKSFFAAPINDTGIFSFAEDTSNISTGKGAEIVRSVFHVSHDTVTIKDVSGEIACGDEVGVYTFTITKTTLKLMLVTDPCDGRANSLSGRVWERTKK
ncbi:MAG TPA: hypothetical protein VII28_15440 [Puia sp.]